MKDILIAVMAAMASTPLLAALTGVTSLQEQGTRTVRVAYTITEVPAVVTLSVETNRGDNVWLGVGGECLTAVSGDVNMLVAPGEHSIAWQPNVSWPNQKIVDGNIRVGVKAWAVDNPPDYMVLGLVTGTVRYYADAASIPFGVTNALYKTENLVMRRIPAADVEWRMGSPTSELGRESNENAHAVKLSADYYMGIYPVTQRQNKIVTGLDYFKSGQEGDDNPATYFVYAEAAEWNYGVVAKLNSAFSGMSFNFPTEAQWEYACRAGEGAALYTGREITTDDKAFCANADEVAWFGDENTGANGNTSGLRPVGQKQPNGWGLYDMLGNVCEYCLDLASSSAPAAYDVGAGGAALLDPTGPATGARRIVRGGNWWYRAKWCRSAYRSSQTPSSKGDTIGMRLVAPARAVR